MASKVLLVEDSLTQAVLILGYLKTSKQFDVSHVKTLGEACEILRGGDPPDLVVLDLNLPDSSGLATYAELHSQFPDTPIVILSGHENEQLAVRAVSDGAQDYLAKSSVDAPLLVRSLQYAMERSGRQLAERQNVLLERDLDVARQIQQHLLPSAPPSVEGFDIASACLPAAACAGDFFDFIALHPTPNVAGGDGGGDAPPNGWDLVIADVSGHGFGPALIMVGTRRVLRTCATLHDDLGEILTLANQSVFEDTLPEQFVTLFHARLDPKSRALTYSAAGHPAWIIAPSGEARQLTYTGLPLGLAHESRYESYGPVYLQAGDVLLLMTDGAWEACSTDFEQIGWERLFETVHRHRQQPAAEIVAELVSEVTQFSHPNPINDDVTIVLAKVLDAA